MHDILNTPFTKSNTNTNTTNNNNISQLVIFTTFVIQSINIPSGTSHQLSFATTPAQLSDRSLSTCAVPLRGLTAGRLISPDPTDDALPPHGPTDDRYSHVTSSQFPYQESYSTQNVIAAALAVWERVYHYIIIIMLHIYITTILHLYILVRWQQKTDRSGKQTVRLLSEVPHTRLRERYRVGGKYRPWSHYGAWRPG